MKKNRWFTILFIMSTILLAGCASGEPAGQAPKSISAETPVSEPAFSLVEPDGSLALQYAKHFQVDYYGDTLLVTIDGSDRFLVVKEGGEVSEGLPPELPVYSQPFTNVYLASSQTMDFFRKLGCLERVKMTSTKAKDWSLPDIRKKVEDEEILYIGKYNAPDYELLIAKACDLCVENTMIYHNPETKELIEKLKIPVFVEKSSYEEDPLGRMEWIKLYGCLMGKEKEAESFFEDKVSEAEETISEAGNSLEEKKSVAFFYITANGQVNIRKPGDYISKMIELAGGRYIFSGEETDGAEGAGGSSLTITMEEFYDKAKDADLLIYNSTIDAELTKLSELTDKSPLLADFTAVKEKNVWGTEKDLFQEITGTADMIRSLSLVLRGEEQDSASVEYMHRLQ